MSSMLWARHIAQLGTSDPLGVILHLGAGEGALVPALLQSGARRILLHEPNPVFQASLQRLCAANQTVELRTTALATEEGDAQLRIFNIARQSSLYKPTELYSLFPGLREVQSHPVGTQTLAGMLAGVPMDEDYAHVLIVDTPGAEHDVIAQLSNLPSNQHFRHVFLRASHLPLYKGSRGAGALLQSLVAQGYQITAEDGADADFTCLCLTHLPPQNTSEADDPTEAAQMATARELASLRQHLSQVQHEHALLSADLLDLQKRYRILSEEKEARDHLLAVLAERLATSRSPS